MAACPKCGKAKVRKCPRWGVPKCRRCGHLRLSHDMAVLGALVVDGQLSRLALVVTGWHPDRFRRALVACISNGTITGVQGNV